MKYYVYKITNLVNGKIYIGKTADVRKRWNKHKAAARKKSKKDYTYVHRALNKYGFDNFSVETIAEYDLEKDCLTAETAFIKLYNTRDRDIGYNLTDGGDGPSGFKPSDETRRKMSEAKKGKYVGEENPFYGKRHTEEYKRQSSKRMKDAYAKNPQKYDQLNIQQCALTTQECLGIQRQYLQQQTSMEELAKNHSTNLHTIHSIIHGTYFAIRGHSIITDETFDQIKRNKHAEQSLQYKKLTIEQEKEIVNKYTNKPIRLKELCKEYKVSEPTMRKVLRSYGIKILRSFPRGKLADKLPPAIVREIKEKYATNQYGYKQLGIEYGMSSSSIKRIVKS